MSSPSSFHVVWFKRDLRVADHRPLTDASAAGPVLCLWAFEPSVWSAPEVHGSQLRFIDRSLAELDDALRDRGGRLVVVRGEIVDILDRLLASGRRRGPALAGLWSHEETGLEVTWARDRAVKAWSRRHHIPWTEHRQFGVVRGLRNRDGWASRWNRFMADPPLAAPHRIQDSGVDPSGAGLEVLPRGSSEGSGFLPETVLGPPRSGAQSGGLVAGAATLRSFLNERGHPYPKAMSSPLTAPDACSRLSPHLAYGTVSLRTVHHAVEERAMRLKDGGGSGVSATAGTWRRALASFRKRLRWHDHFIQKLESEPEIEFRNMSRVYDGLRDEDEDGWDAETRARFEAWEAGRTGYPMVDACMRYLDATGWINFRMRAMLVSFAAYHLWLHWRPVGRVLAQRFVDFEPGIHYSQCQMQSGVTGINALRIYSPARQLQDHDPDGTFVRQWVPELAGVPTDILAEPHRMSAALQDRVGCVIGRDYPAPLVEHREAYRSARARIGEIRKTPEAREESQRVYRRHGSRRRGRRSALARKPGASDQLSLDV